MLSSRHSAVLGGAALLLGFIAPPAHAGTNSYNSFAAFQAASATTVQATFENFKPVDTNYFGPITEGAVTFTASNLYVATPHGPAAKDSGVALASNVLTETGNEDITMTFSGPTTAVGWDSYTNYSTAPTVRVYDTNNVLLATFPLTQAPDTLGFFGVISSTPIGRINWLAVDGAIQDTAIDNIRTGASAPPAVPETSSVVSLGLLLLLGVGAAAISRRRKAGAAL